MQKFQKIWKVKEHMAEVHKIVETASDVIENIDIKICNDENSTDPHLSADTPEQNPIV